MKISCSKIDVILARQEKKRKDLAASCDISKQGISAILKRESCLTATAGRIARALGVDVTEIMEDPGLEAKRT